jgi:diguanylate cyclase (GGDEF)-like protein/PAS domain S-box-containing protein
MSKTHVAAGPDAPGERHSFHRALDALLTRYPDAYVAAIGEDGLFLPIPPEFPLGEHRALSVRSTLELVVPEERELVLRTWERARAEGGAHAQLHLRADPSRIAVIHYVDARPTFGTYIGVLVGLGGLALPAMDQARPSLPRIARVHKNELAVFLSVDDATTQLLGWSAVEMVGHRSLDFIHPDDQERAVQSWIQMLSEPAHPQPAVRLRHRRLDGGWTWFEVTNHNNLAVEAGGDVLAEMIDISDEMAAQEALQAREQLLQRLTEALPIGVFQVLRDRRIAYTNERLHRILGVGPAATVEAQLATIAAEDRPALEDALTAALDSGIDCDLELRLRPSDEAGARRCLMRIRALTDSHGVVTGAVVSVEDVTRSAQLRAELERRASHDLLTRLLNRTAVLAALEGAIAGQGVEGTAAIFIDLDGFKEVNDRYGHVAGDELLRIVADRLTISVRAGDPLGRFGGDEFLVACRNVGSVDAALAVAERIALALRQPVQLGRTTVDMRASVGVAFTRRRIKADRLVGRADAAMYISKQRREGTPVLFSTTISRKIRTHAGGGEVRVGADGDGRSEASGHGPATTP